MKRMLWAAIAAATALVPAAAIAQERGEHRGNGGWMRPEGFRPQGGPGGQGAQRPQGAPPAQPQDRGNWQRSQPQAQPQNGGNWQRPQGAPQAMDRGAWRRPDGQSRPAFQAPQGGQRPDWQNRGDPRGQQSWQGRGWNDGPHRQWNGARDWGRRDGNRGWNDRRDWDRASGWRGDRGAWNSGWRSDQRYDWRAYRDYNRGLYRLPRYYPPARWSYGYRRFSIGYRLDSFLFTQQYWISDPYSYRLPDVWGPYRWVRYYDDALLVDVDTGEVVDVIYGIFL